MDCFFSDKGYAEPRIANSFLSQGQRGFTLAEVMMVIAIMGVILLIALPSLQDFVRDNRLSANMNEFMASFHYARSEAVKRGARVTMCKSATGTSCGGNWENGWITFLDADDDGVVDVGETILTKRGALENGLTLRGNNNVSIRITFDSRGYTRGHNGTLRLCDFRGAASAVARVITVSGRIRAATDTTGDGIVDVGGANVSCP